MTSRAMPVRPVVLRRAVWWPYVQAAAPSILAGLVGLVVWESFSQLANLPRSTLAAPSQVAQSFWDNRDLLAVHAVPTIVHTIGGFAASLVLSIAAAALVVHSSIGRYIVTPFAVIMNVAPKEAYAPLLILWFGTGDMSRLLLAFLIAFFPIFINAVSGFSRVDEDLLRLSRLLRASSWQVFTQVRLPAAAPEIFSGMKISVTLAVIGVIVAELIAGRRGLGYLLLFATARHEMAFLMSILVVLALIGLVAYGLVLVAERFVVYWRG